MYVLLLSQNKKNGPNKTKIPNKTKTENRKHKIQKKTKQAKKIDKTDKNRIDKHIKHESRTNQDKKTKRR